MRGEGTRAVVGTTVVTAVGRVQRDAFGAKPILSASGSAWRGGFTLLELLVTLSIMSVLAFLVTSAVRGSRERSAATQCLSHLRALAQANLCYAADHEGRFCLASEKKNNRRWHGERADRKSAFDPTKGPLAPYLGREARVKSCPTLERVLKGKDSFETGSGGYGYNEIYIGGTPSNRLEAERLGNLEQATRTLMFADTALSRENGLQEYPFAEPWQFVSTRGDLQGTPSPSVHFRHNGRANVVWCDGHVSAELPTQLGGKNHYGGNDTELQLGWFGPREENGYWNPRATATLDAK